VTLPLASNTAYSPTAHACEICKDMRRLNVMCDDDDDYDDMRFVIPMSHDGV